MTATIWGLGAAGSEESPYDLGAAAPSPIYDQAVAAGVLRNRGLHFEVKRTPLKSANLQIQPMELKIEN